MAEWAALRERIEAKGLAEVPIDKAVLPVRAGWVFSAFEIDTLGALVAFDPRELLRIKNVGRTTLAAIIREAALLAESTAATRAAERKVTLPQLGVTTIPPAAHRDLYSRWARLRREVFEQEIGTRPFRKSGLSTRARGLLDDIGCRALGDVVGLDPGDLLGRHNIGRSTLESILRRAGQVASEQRQNLKEGTSFVRIVDDLLTGMKGAAADVVHLRFMEHLKLHECGHRLKLTRERIRQLEKRVLVQLAERCREAGWHGASILDDGLIEFDELQAEATSNAAFTSGLYVTLARATLLKARGLRQLEAFYGRELEVLLDDLADSFSALAGRLTDDDIRNRAAELTPALGEWPPERLVQEVRRRLGGIGRSGRVRTVPLLRALVRQAGGEMSLAALRHKLEGFLAAGGRAKALTDAAVRAIVHRSKEFCMRDASTIARPEPESAAQRAWMERAVAFVQGSRRPASLISFLQQYPDCEIDECALASLLNRDSRVERVGRRLYSPVNESSGLPVRVVDILRRALESETRPWSHRELLHHVRERRDLKSSQVERYLPRIPELVRYSAHCVGLTPVSRTVMLQLLGTEQFVLDRLSVLGDVNARSVEEIWLDEAGDDDRLALADVQTILKAASSWNGVQVVSGDPLRFVKEV